MIKILPLIFAFGLLSCSQPRQSDSQTTDSSSLPDNLANDYNLASTDRDPDSESLLADNDDLVMYSKFSTNGTNIREKEYGGGDCGGKFKQIVLETDTLTIDKYDCGDYGFGNTEYIKDGDSLRYVRKYKMEWSPDDKGNEFKVSETIYEFSTIGLTKRTRAKSIKGWSEFRINEENFEESRISGQLEYNELKKELKDLVLKENFRPRRVS